MGGDAEALSRLVARVYVGLARWFGSYGAQALMTRALAQARIAHPVLATVTANASTSPHVSGWPLETSDTLRLTVTPAAVALFSTLLVLLTRLIGDDLAASLLEQSAEELAPSHPETDVSPNANES